MVWDTFIKKFKKTVENNLAKYNKEEADWIIFTLGSLNFVYDDWEKSLKKLYKHIYAFYNNEKDVYYNVEDKHNTDKLFIDLYKEYYD